MRVGIQPWAPVLALQPQAQQAWLGAERVERVLQAEFQPQRSSLKLARVKCLLLSFPPWDGLPLQGHQQGCLNCSVARAAAQEALVQQRRRQPASAEFRRVGRKLLSWLPPEGAMVSMSVSWPYRFAHGVGFRAYAFSDASCRPSLPQTKNYAQVKKFCMQDASSRIQNTDSAKTTANQIRGLGGSCSALRNNLRVLPQRLTNHPCLMN